MTLNTLGLQNGNVDQITPPQELAWNLEMKRKIIWTIHFHFGVPAVRDDHAPDQKEQAEKIHKKPAVKDQQTLIFCEAYYIHQTSAFSKE